MKFFSKINNYRILLTPTIPGNPYMQIPEVHGDSVKFTYGVAEVDDEKVIALMKAHKSFNKEFFAEAEDPFKDKRTSNEPVHDIMELDGGRPGKTISSKQSPIDQGKIMEMVKAMAVQLIEEGGYQKVEEAATEPVVQTMVSAESDDEPMDSALMEAGEIEETVPTNRVVPPEIKADAEEPEDDGINPLAGASSEGEDVSLEEDESLAKTTKKTTPKKAKNLK